MKRVFDCGHAGKGKYCHRCAESDRASLRRTTQASNRAAIDAKRKQENADRRAKDQHDVIDLSALDHLAAMKNKARRIIAAIAEGANYFQFGGKRLITMKKEILSIPIGNSYRLIYRVKPMTPVECLSHEAYNDKYVS